jgi:hypothetical protein
MYTIDPIDFVHTNAKPVIHCFLSAPAFPKTCRVLPLFRLTYSCSCANQRPHDDIRKRSLSKMLLSITISVSLGPSLLPWTIIEVNEDTYTFEALFTSIQGGRFNAVDDLRGLEKRKASSIARRTEYSCCHNRIMTSLEF